jgi:hypothetical protein
MKLWQAPARVLPVTTRPFGGETVISYTRRLSEANALGPTAVLRALGEVTHGTGRHLLDRDALLNGAALHRLEALTGLPSRRLREALPALRSPGATSLASGRPVVRPFRLRLAARPACLGCTQRRATTTALVHATIATRVCYRHRHWLEGRQLSIAPAPVIVHAHTRCRHLLRTAGHAWAASVVHEATSITATWALDSDRWHTRLAERWRTRAQRLGVPTSHPAVRLPETVALAHVMTDLDWRRHVALTDTWDLASVHRNVARQTGATSATLVYRGNDAFTSWVRFHRARFAHRREPGMLMPWVTRPLPEKGLFK